MRVDLCSLLRAPQHLAAALGAELLTVGSPDGEIRGLATDSREVVRGDLFVALHGRKSDGCAFLEEALARGACGLLLPSYVAAPEGDYYCFSAERPEQALLRAAAARRERTAARVIAVCGSAGKTTAKEAIAAICAKGGSVRKSEGNFNSTVGMPLSLLSMEEADFFVLELGVNHAGEMEAMARALAPDLAVLLNVGSAHIGHFADFAELVREKTSVARFLREDGMLLASEGLSAFSFPCKREQMLFCGEGARADYRAVNIHIDQKGTAADIITPKRVITNLRWSIPGKMAALMLTFAAAVGDRLGFSSEAIRGGLAAADATAPRLRRHACGSRLLLDDAYNASPETVLSALEVLGHLAGDRPRVAVLGDMLELGELTEALHSAVGRAVVEHRIDYLFTFGKAAEYIALEAATLGLARERILSFSSDEGEALALAIRKLAPPNAVILFKASGKMALGQVVAMVRRE